MSNKVKFTTMLCENLVKELKIEAINIGCNPNDILTSLLEKYFEQKNFKEVLRK